MLPDVRVRENEVTYMIKRVLSAKARVLNEIVKIIKYFMAKLTVNPAQPPVTSLIKITHSSNGLGIL
jgi:hypothetical protein